MNANYSDGWRAPNGAQEKLERANCHAEPVPSELELAAISAIKERGGYILFDSAADVIPLPIIRTTRRMHGMRLNILQSAGTDLFDYQRVPALLHDSRSVPALINLGMTMRLDAYSFPQIVGQMPSHLDRFARKVETCWFDAGEPERKWSLIYGRKSLLRHFNRAKKDLELRIITLDDSEKIAGWLTTLAQLHHERWRFDGLPSAFDEPWRIEQYRAVLRRSRLTVVLDGEEPLAMHWGLLFGGIFLWHTPVINVRYLDYSPLEILLFGVAKFSEEQGWRGLDFGLGEEQYKKRFANRQRVVFDLFLPVSLKAKMIYWARRWVEPAKLRSTVERVAGEISQLRARVRRARTRVTYFAAPIDQPPADISNDGTFREITDWTVLVDLFRHSGLQVEREHYARIKRGERMVCWCHDGYIVAMGWCSKQAANSPFVVRESCEQILAPGKIILYDFSTPAKFCNRGYCKDMLCAAIRHYHPAAIVSYSVSTNAAARGAIKSAGFKEVSRGEIT